jgi:uncharacterized protein YggT (Ycf19 family)
LTLIDFILNLAGLLLWLNWRAAELPVAPKSGTSILSTLRPASPPSPRYYYWAGLPILLVARALFYWQAAIPVHWTPRLPLGPITLAFRSDLAGRMILFSVLSFLIALGILYLWLLFLSWLNQQVSNANPIQRLARIWLGRLERWPGPVKLLAPIAAAMVGWCLLHPILVRLDMVPPSPVVRLLAQGAIISLAGYLTLKYLLVALLTAYLISSYIYLGEFSLWNFIDVTARRVLRPLQKLPLRIWKIDLRPLLAILLILLAAELVQRALFPLCRKLL